MENKPITNNKNFFSIEKAFSYAFESFKKDWKKFLAITLIMIAISIFFSILGSERGPRMIFNIVGQIINFWIGFNIAKIYIDYAFGREVKILDLFKFSLDSKYLKKILKYLAVNIIYFLVVVLGLILLVIPGIYFAIRFQYAAYNIIEKDSKILEAFKLSSKMTKGTKWKLILFAIVNILIVLLGLVLLFIGIIPAISIIMLAGAYVYKKLLNNLNLEKEEKVLENF